MAQPCKVCGHPQRIEIDRGLLDGRSRAALARAFAVSADAVERHARKHVREALDAATEGRGALYGNRLVERLMAIQRRTLAILEAARDPALALKAIAQARSNVEMEARLTGELKDHQVNQALVVLDSETGARMAAAYLETYQSGERSGGRYQTSNGKINGSASKGYIDVSETCPKDDQ